MVVGFTFVFFEFALFSSRLMKQETAITAPLASPIIVSEATKLFTTTGIPELIFVNGDSEFVLAVDALNPTLNVKEGSGVIPLNGVALGSQEAMMMRQEKEFSKIGDPLEDFAGKTGYSVTGILAPTGTVLDLAHIISKAAFSTLPTGTVLKAIDDQGSLKLFYAGDIAQLPDDIKKGFPEKSVTSIEKNGKIYVPIYVGSEEAAMMRQKKLFNKTGDTIDGFFGNNVYVAGVLPQSGTVFDLLHYIPRDMTVSL
jgi:hypothetical protein